MQIIADAEILALTYEALKAEAYHVHGPSGYPGSISDRQESGD